MRRQPHPAARGAAQSLAEVAVMVPVLTRSHGKSIIYSGFSMEKPLFIDVFLHGQSIIYRGFSMVFPSYEPLFIRFQARDFPSLARRSRRARDAESYYKRRSVIGWDRWSVAAIRWIGQHFQWENPGFRLGKIHYFERSSILDGKIH